MNYLEEKIQLHREMIDSLDLGSIEKVSGAVINCYRNGGKLIIFGNGGSAADAMHFAAEFEGQLSSIDKGRKALSALTPFNISALTAISNDFDYGTSFARFVEANAKKGDVVIGISTSGNSKNVVNALHEAKKLGAVTVGFTGNNGGQVKDVVDILLNVPVSNVSVIQEGHLVSYHRVCALVIKELFGYDALK
ncbi:MAG: SIS domain-containing protein [Candidatus Aenigmarchaeota archaeon]|nr:SIS domain-containing protein [Candidatus Aenigmarchaeota archaeon]